MRLHVEAQYVTSSTHVGFRCVANQKNSPLPGARSAMCIVVACPHVREYRHDLASAGGGKERLVGISLRSSHAGGARIIARRPALQHAWMHVDRIFSIMLREERLLLPLGHSLAALSSLARGLRGLANRLLGCALLSSGPGIMVDGLGCWRGCRR